MRRTYPAEAIVLARALVIGDTHIPDRAEAVPRGLEALASGEQWDLVLFTGDFTGREVLDWVKGLGRSVLYVRGNMDYLPLPRTAKVEVGGLRIGLHHGDGVHPRGNPAQLERIARGMEVDVLVTGHTHSPFVTTGPSGRVLLLNPGSLTGAWGGGGGSMRPSLMVLEIGGPRISVELYELMRSGLARRSYETVLEGDRWRISLLGARL
ncbi:MAG: metallophosphoesterase [Desulfurococcaceae archaeon]